ncbi:immunoglobulin-binding protein 1b [Athalia rosae]|uniref:immunoglobulin-binding protein 1b n=1 Tax=Athalia rosae TaxID=37344 RepID=UPI002034348D|nr:immunoglobulin-binding protein 1b [Athalia rosae]XP_048506279.1 immunoglobulin-binding protein 1b [Athalia rosae]
MMDSNTSSGSKPTFSFGREDDRDVESLSQIYEDAFALFNNINKTQEATNSPKVQSDVRKAMNMLENATRLVSLLNMFSTNENFDEVPTSDIKYLLLPALLGTLTLKICGSNDRLHIVEVAEIYFTDFLKRLRDYGVIDMEIPEYKSDEEKSVCKQLSNTEKITSMVSSRNAKLQRYKEQKELESRLQMLQENMTNPNIDEESKREYYLTLIKSYVNQALQELSSIAAEKPIIEHMMKVGHTEFPASQNSKKFKAPAIKLQPIIITRDEVQKKVYGAGYPSLPVLTVQEFYEKRVKDGDWPDPSQKNQMGGKSLQDFNNDRDGPKEEDIEDEAKEKQVELDDPELLARTRAMDEYKDTHRRGWGNRANRS